VTLLGNIFLDKSSNHQSVYVYRKERDYIWLYRYFGMEYTRHIDQKKDIDMGVQDSAPKPTSSSSFLSPFSTMISSATMFLGDDELLFDHHDMKTYVIDTPYLSPRVRSDRIRRPTSEIVTISKLEVFCCPVYIALIDSRGKAPAVIRRKEVRILMIATPDCDSERPEASRPSRTCIVIDVDSCLYDIVAVGATVGVNHEGGSTGGETSHDGDGRSDRETHSEDGVEYLIWNNRV
jgi:hypothetical protein